MNNTTTHPPPPHAMRVLSRPPPAPAPAPAPTATPPQPPPQNGVVVVGFIGNRRDDLSHFINKVIDSNVFGSANLDTSFEANLPEMNKWFDTRKLSFYHHKSHGILYLQFCLSQSYLLLDDMEEEDREFGDLQGLLFMFSVCHVIILIQEGFRFDTQMLRKFRVLQTAKHAMAPFIRSLNVSTITSRPRSSAYSQTTSSGASPKNPSPGKSRGILNRNASTMSSLGSYTSLLPGQCTPVILFVFIDDFTEIGLIEEPSETTSSNFSSNLNSSTRPGQPRKGSGSVVVLSRPVNKSEGGIRKKLQSSLEAQIRFSIKKCRTLSGLENSHVGSRSGATANFAPLFSLDASKAVSLVDASSNQSGESLEFAIGLVEEVLSGKATPDSLLLESHQQTANKEDILSVKEFICRQSDILRGRGGLVAGSNSGAAAGVGMVAVAAAAAAASTGSGNSGKTVTAPELPTLEIWSSSCQLILQGLLSAKCIYTYDFEITTTHGQDTVRQAGENVATSSDLLDSAVSHLKNGSGLTTRFSTLWCQKAFPIAREVYLDGLPPCYPSSHHDNHLKKAIRALISMVKGPAVQLYVKKLEDECTSIWSSGRQLCDAVSLTGKPCIHQRHDIKTIGEDEIKPHSSGVVYLHACACGRSRRLRQDPFDYESANIGHNIFADCDKLLPAVQLPEGNSKGPIQPSSWNIVRVGGARYYDPSKGLLQSGFSATEKFLLRWTIFLENIKEANQSDPIESEKVSLDGNIKVQTVSDADSQTYDAARLTAGGPQNGVGTPTGLSSDFTGSSSRSISIGKGSSNFTMRKAFSEVVAGPAASNSAFPPLFSTKQPVSVADNGVNIHHRRHRGLAKVGEIVDNLGTLKVENITSIHKRPNDSGIAGGAYEYGIPSSDIGNDFVPLSMKSSGKNKGVNSEKSVTIYVGFEHECPHGHRFILTMDHLNELGSSYTMPKENVYTSLVDDSDKKQDPAKSAKAGGHGRTRRQANGTIVPGGNVKTKNPQKSKEKVANNGNMGLNKPIQSTRQGKDQNEREKAYNTVKDLHSDLRATTVDDGVSAFSLLNRHLPIFMNCPHCKDSKNKNGTSNVNFASTVSQLQRIFVVTPSFPVVLAAAPVVQFEVSCLPPSVPDREQLLRFSLGCPVILPPESFLSMRLPFVYGVELEDRSLHSLKPLDNQPQLTAYIMKGTALQVVSYKSNLDSGPVT